jgi:hypothetical protein
VRPLVKQAEAEELPAAQALAKLVQAAQRATRAPVEPVRAAKLPEARVPMMAVELAGRHMTLSQPAPASRLQSIRIGREDRVVRVWLSEPLDALTKLVF